MPDGPTHAPTASSTIAASHTTKPKGSTRLQPLSTKPSSSVPCSSKHAAADPQQRPLSCAPTPCSCCWLAWPRHDTAQLPCSPRCRLAPLPPAACICTLHTPPCCLLTTAQSTNSGTSCYHCQRQLYHLTLQHTTQAPQHSAPHPTHTSATACDPPCRSVLSGPLLLLLASLASPRPASPAPLTSCS